MSLRLEWIGHSSFKISGSKNIYIDPWKISRERLDGDLILISHIHHDHFAFYDIKKVAAEPWNVIAPPDVITEMGSGQSMAPYESCESAGIHIEAIPSYTQHKLFHPRKMNWLGYLITIDSIRIYYAGDSDCIPEMGKLGNIDIALLPVGGKFTMNAQEAAQAVELIQPALTIPYHWGDIIGTHEDAEQFAELSSTRDGGKVQIMQPGQIIEIDKEQLTHPDQEPKNMKSRLQSWKKRLKGKGTPPSLL